MKAISFLCILLFDVFGLFPHTALAAGRGVFPRIAYGSNAKPNQFPYAVNFRIDREMCGGSIFAPRVILSAAHCVVDRKGNVLPVGKYNSTVNVGSIKMFGGTQMAMANVFIPTQYTGQSPYFADISLIELQKPVSKSIPKIALASKDTFTKNGTALTVYGWGMMENQMFAKDLQYTTMTTQTQTFCERAFKQTWNGTELPPDHFCVGEIRCFSP